MSTKFTANPTKKLESIRQKITTLQQEENKITHDLSHELAKILVSANALEIDFETLIGGVLDVVTNAKTDATKSESWQKSGQKFLQNWNRREQKKERPQNNG